MALWLQTCIIQFDRALIQADAYITKLCEDKDDIIRMGGMYMIGLAYCSTSISFAVNKLLHHAVSDVSDNVRRSAVICLAFVLSNSQKRLPEMVRLLSHSYNPHVRYGAALALGMGCPASANPDALKILNHLATDNTDFVRQGIYQHAFILNYSILLYIKYTYITRTKSPKLSNLLQFGHKIKYKVY